MDNLLNAKQAKARIDFLNYMILIENVIYGQSAGILTYNQAQLLFARARKAREHRG